MGDAHAGFGLQWVWSAWVWLSLMGDDFISP